MLYHFGSLSSLHATAIGVALFAAIFGYTSVMDQYKWSVGFEWVANCQLLFCLTMGNGYFIIPIIYWAWTGYLLISLTGTWLQALDENAC